MKRLLGVAGLASLWLLQSCGSSDSRRKAVPNEEEEDAGSGGDGGGKATGGAKASGGKSGTGGTAAGGAPGAGGAPAAGGSAPAGGAGGASAGGAPPDAGPTIECPANTQNCDSNPDDCETPLVDDQHCGTCTRDCTVAAGSTCNATGCTGVTLFPTEPFGSDGDGARTWGFGDGAAFQLGFGSYVLRRYPLDGGPSAVVWDSGGAIGGTESVVVTPTHVLWAQRGAPSTVLRKLRTAAPTDLPEVFFTPEAQPQFMRLQGTTLFWSTGDYQAGGLEGFIYSRSMTAPASDPGTRIVNVTQGVHGAMLALNATTDALYWVTDDATGGAAYEIRTTPLTGGTPTAVPGGAITGGFSTKQATLRTVGTTLYFNRNVDTAFTNGIYQFEAGDAAAKQLVSAEDVSSFIVDGASFYLVRQNMAGVFKAPIAGGAAVQVTDAQAQRILGADADSLYVVLSSCCSSSIIRVPK